MSKRSHGDAVSRVLHNLQRRCGAEASETDPLEPSFVAEPTERVSEIPTFNPDVSYPLTPMLQARFRFASRIEFCGDTWLSISEMPKWMKRKSVRKYHSSLRDHWTGSAPMLYPDDKLTLFGVTVDVPDSLIYCVWGDGEPAIWTYSGLDQRQFTNLQRYLEWCLESL